MMKSLCLAFSLLVATASVAAAAPDAPPPMREPIEKWVVDYGETYCTASRIYGTKEKPLTLALRPSASGSVVRLVFARPGAVLDAYHFGVTVSHQGGTTKASGIRFGTPDAKRDIVWINLDRKALEGLGTSAHIAIQGGKVNEQFAVPQIGAVLKSLETCNADLRKHWNVDAGSAESQLPTPARPVKPLAELFGDQDYPRQAANEGASGIAEMTLLVDETGTLKDCTIDSTSGVASLDAMGCALLLKRAKFTPALDAAGKPVRSVFCTRMIWRMDS